MEKFGDPHALYGWTQEKREDALTYLYNEGLRSGRITSVKPVDESVDMGRLFGTDFAGAI